MRFHGVVLLAASTLLSSINGRAMAITTLNDPVIPHPFAAAQHEAPTTRMLRADGQEGDDEDRAGWSFFKKGELKTWLEEGVSPDAALVRLNQDARVHNSLSDPAVKKLAKYVSMHNQKFGTGETTVETLSRGYSEAHVAAMIQAGLRSSDTKTKALAEKLQTEQFRLWGNLENNSPLAIFRKLNFVKQPGDEAFLVMSSDAYQALKGYMSVFNHRNQEVAEFQVFKDVYGDRGLALMISHAKHSDDGRISSAALMMQRAQFTHWDDILTQPKEVYRLFNLRAADRTRGDKFIVNDYATWVNVGNQLREG